MNGLRLIPLLACLLLVAGIKGRAQSGDATVSTRIDVSHITVGDPAYLFLEVKHHPAQCSIQWAALPDTFSKLEITERGKIDTVKEGDLTTYKQRLSVTGFDSGMFTIPRFAFTVNTKGGTPYAVQSDSVQLLVQTVAVDTSKAFRPIKGIIGVQYTWRDYIGWIIGGIIFLLLAIVALIYFIRSKRNKIPVQVEETKEPLHEKTLKLLDTLDAEQLWQKGQVKEYYVRLTDILRSYVETQYHTPALELTTDELIDKARITPGLLTIARPLETILRTADLAKFAKAQPLPQEHIQSMELAKDLIHKTIPAPIAQNPSNPNA